MTNPLHAEDEGGSVWQAASILGLGSHGKMVMGKWLALLAPATPGILVTDTSVLNSSVFRR